MTEYEKLKLLDAQADILIAARSNSSTDKFKVWKNRVERLIVNHYGNDSIEHTQFKKVRFAPQAYFGTETAADLISCCKTGISTVKGMLADYLEEWEEDSMKTPAKKSNKVFIVHGHDETLKIQVARLLEQQGIEAIILHEQPNAGKTIIEKIEHYSDVGAAVILFTPDDTGRANRESNLKPRARQNVVFEAGYFMGYLGREKTVMIVKDTNMEIPGDLHGVVYTSVNGWQYDLMKELREMGLSVDLNKVKC